MTMTGHDLLLNLAAWAETQGFEPDKDYTEGGEPPDVTPPVEPLPPGYLSKNFKESEFRCKGTGTMHPNGMDPKLIDALQRIRDHYGVPVTINSGYRSPQHNANVGGAKNSQHLYGKAADFVVKGVSPSQVYRDLDPLWPGGLGKYANFTHIDVRGSKARW